MLWPQLFLCPSEARDRLSRELMLTKEESLFTDLAGALESVILAEPIERIIRDADAAGLLEGYTLLEQAQSALAKQLITVEQLDVFIHAVAARKQILAVDDFAQDALVVSEGRRQQTDCQRTE